VGDRSELNDVVSQMVAELSALHIRVGGGDLRGSADTVTHASLGARLEKADGGWRVARIYQSDPDLPAELGPLARPGVNVSEGDVIRAIHPAELLLGKAGKQTLIELASGKKAIVYPVTLQQEANLRYADWEYSRKQMVDRLSGGRIGYIHLRAMGSGDINEFARDYYPQFTKDALIIDVRNNGGGNIDSWILEKLQRTAWMYWSSRVGDATWNMQYAFRGPMATIVNENSGSDGEIFPEGFRKLGLGKVFGTRTWGGEIWLTQSNTTADRGIATAAEFGVFADGKWIIEQHGVDPDVVVENLPAASFAGSDAQLEATVRHLLDEVAKRPNPVPVKPAYPKK
jgi:tricorn protease